MGQRFFHQCGFPPAGHIYAKAAADFARRLGRDAADDRIVEIVEAVYGAEPDLIVVTSDRGLVGRLPPGVGGEGAGRFRTRIGLAEARSRTDGYFDFKEGSLYPALHRLEKAGSVEAHFAPSSTGGSRRRYYRLTDAGVKQLAEKREACERFNGAVGALREAR